MKDIKKILTKAGVNHKIVSKSTIVQDVQAINDIAKYLKAVRTLINKAGDQAEKYGAEIGKKESFIKNHIKLSKDKKIADKVIEVIKKNKLDTGDGFGSDFIDILEQYSGETIYPPKWSVEKPRYSFIDN